MSSGWRLWVLFFCAIGPFSSHAEVQFNKNQIWSRARLIPGGQQVLSLRSSYQNTTDRFSATGDVKPAGSAYARALSWGEVLAATPAANAAMVQAQMVLQNASPADAAASATYQVEFENTQMELGWAYGLTREWMIGFGIPVIHRRTIIKSRVQMSSAMSAVVKQEDANLLASSGYDEIPKEEHAWLLGDVSLFSQEELWKSFRWNWSLQQMVRVPAGRPPRAADYIQYGDDGGQVDAGLTSLVDYQKKWWTVGFRVGAVMQLPDTVKVHAPVNSAAPNSLDSEARRDLGDWAWTAVDGVLKVSKTLSLNLEHAFLSKAADRYDGGTLSDSDYARLADGSSQELHETKLGCTYEVDRRSVRRGDDEHWQVAAAYSQPWLGRNSSNAGSASVELTSYF